MYSNKGFSLIELMIVVGIIAILTAIGLPMYKDYVLRVRIAEAINDITILARDAQIAFGEGGLKTAIDLEQLAKNAKLGLNPNFGCPDGFKRALVIVPKNKLSYLGITSPYIRTVEILGQINQPCTGPKINDDTVDIGFTLDTEALGVPNKSGNKDYNYIIFSVSKDVIYEDLKGNVTHREVGSVVSCGIFPYRGGSMSQFDFSISALPHMCRYYALPVPTPRRLVELSGY